MSRTKDVILDRGHMMWILQDPMFFKSVPDVAFLQPSADWAAYAADTGMQAGTCKTCTDRWQHFKPVIMALILKIADMAKLKEAGLESIRTYLAKKKQYDVGQITIYYKGKSDDRLQKLTF